MYGIIYKATNKVNGKVYIGQTCRTLKIRKLEHRSDGKCLKYNTYFYKAINKYGGDSFVFEEIDKADTKEELNEKEIYWISFYDTFKNGYNSTIGGDGHSVWDRDSIEYGIRKIMNDLSIEHFPTRNQILNQNSALLSTIASRGGMYHWSKELGIRMTKEVIFWTEEMVEKEIIRISDSYLDGKTMPNCNLLNEITSSHSLSSAISKGLGYSGWAKKLGFKLSGSTYNLGMTGKFKVKKIIESMGLEVSIGKRTDKYDLMINNHNNIYISCSNPIIKRGSRIHKFQSKSATNNDINIFCALDEDGDVENYFVVPHTVFNKTNCTIDIGKRGKYYKFQDWNLLYNITSN